VIVKKNGINKAAIITKKSDINKSAKLQGS